MSALNVSSASQSGSLKLFGEVYCHMWQQQATEHTMLGHNRMTRNEFGDDVRIGIKIDALQKKSTHPWLTFSAHLIRTKSIKAI